MISVMETQSIPLFFPIKQFSSRFGDAFFTANIVSYEVAGECDYCNWQYVNYAIEVQRGKEKWLVKRRYSDFFVFEQKTRNIKSSAASSTASLPPKTWYPTVEKVRIYVSCVIIVAPDVCRRSHGENEVIFRGYFAALEQKYCRDTRRGS